jgi:hypothetical protein
MKAGLAILMVCAGVTVPRLFGHHSVSMYDMAHPTTVTGVVTKVEWTNPHAYLYVDVKNAKGELEHWAIEIDSPNFLKHNGWTISTVKEGDTITCTGGQAKSGALTMRCTVVKLANGLELRS